MSKHDPYINKLIFSKYLIRKKIGKGSFGVVYQGLNTTTNEKIALKVEKKEKNQQGTLENEAMRLVYLQGEGIPKVYCYGNNQSHNLLVEELLGKSLEDIFNSYGKPFSLKTVCVLGIEMIKRIQFIHQKYYIHRDIKPDNFMTGRGENEKNIYIIDFGLAKKYYSVSKAQHIKFCTGKHLIGTARYCARNAHRGYEQGRRDDIESIGYVLMYFLLGVLPWQGLKIKKNEDQFEKIAEKKYNTPFEELTQGQPEEFLLFFKYVDGLKFEDQPNYVYIIGLFQTMIDKYCRECFYDFDWKKDSCVYISRDLKENQVVDASLVVNKNNDASGMDYSYEGETDLGEENNQQNINKNKMMKDKDIFVGEDKEQINEENKMNESRNKNNKNDNMNNNKNDNSNNNSNINDERPKRAKSQKNKKNGKLKKDKKQNKANNINNINNLYQTEKKQKTSTTFGKTDNNEINNNEQSTSKIGENKSEHKNKEINIDENINQQNNLNNINLIQNQIENKEEKNYNYNNNNNIEGMNSIKNDINDINDIYEPQNNKELLNTEERKEENNEDNLHQIEDRKIIEGNNENNNVYNNDENDVNKNLFNENSFDEKDSKRERNRNKDKDDKDDKDKKDNNVVCRCIIF